MKKILSVLLALALVLGLCACSGSGESQGEGQQAAPEGLQIGFAKIINRERRKELMKASIAKTESYGPIANRPAVQCKTVSFLSNQGEEPEYYWLTYDEKGNKVCVLFQPTPAVLDVFATRARGKLR